MISTKDNATYTENISEQGFLTISGATTSGFTALEDVTGMVDVWIQNTENPTTFLKCVCTVTGTVGTQTVTINSPTLLSAPTKASNETEWTEALETTVDGLLPEIVIDVTSTSSSLVTPTPITTGDSILTYNATDGQVTDTIGTVSSVSNIDSLILDTINKGTSVTITDLTGNSTSAVWTNNSMYSDFTITSGDVYWEAVLTRNLSSMIGVSTINTYQSGYIGAVSTGWNCYPTATSFQVYHSGTGQTQVSFPSVVGDRIGFRYNHNTGLLLYYVNGIQSSLNSALPAGTDIYIGCTLNNSSVTYKFAEADLLYKPIEASSLESATYTTALTGLTVTPTKAFFNDTVDVYQDIADVEGNLSLVTPVSLNVNVSSTTTSLVSSDVLTLGQTVDITTGHNKVTSGTLGTVTGTGPYTADITAYGLTSVPVSAIDTTTALAGKLTVASKLYDGTKFTFTYSGLVKTGRAIQRKIVASKSGTTVTQPLTTTLKKSGA